jgi:hypothetical protein
VGSTSLGTMPRDADAAVAALRDNWGSLLKRLLICAPGGLIRRRRTDSHGSQKRLGSPFS